MTPHPISEASPVEHDAALPRSADCVVIGGGVVGVSTALFLARAGRNVVLVEKGRVAAEQSSRNWGWIRVQGRDPAEIPIAVEAQALWRELSAQLDTDIGLVQGGVAYLSSSDREIAAFRDWIDTVAPIWTGTRLLTMRETAALVPAAEPGWAGALWTDTDMRAEPFLAVPALARLAAREGVSIAEGCAARGIESDAGRVSGVVTERGTIATGEVVLAGGAWSSLFLRRHGISIPQLSVRESVARTAPMPDMFHGAAADDRLSFRRRADGGYSLALSAWREFYIGPDAFRHMRFYARQALRTFFATGHRLRAPVGYPDAWSTPRAWTHDAASPFEATRILNPAPDLRRVGEMAARFGAAFPASGEVRIEGAWGGMIETLPDFVPVVDRADRLQGLTIATGMSGHGFGAGPAFGRVTADLVMRRDPGHDLSRFRLSRFSDGSRVAPGPTL